MVPCDVPVSYERSSRRGGVKSGSSTSTEARPWCIFRISISGTQAIDEARFLVDETARNVAQRRSIGDAPRRRLRVLGEFHDVSQVSLPASTVPASSSAVREVCEHSSWVEDEEFLNNFEEDLMSPDLHQSVPHSVHDMDEQRRFTVIGTTVPVSGQLRRGDSQQYTDKHDRE